MQRKNNQLVFSPRDLVAYLEGDFAAWMDRRYAERLGGSVSVAGGRAIDGSPQETFQPDEPDEQLKLVAQKGLDYEKTFLHELMDSGHDVAQIPQDDQAQALTAAAMKAGKSIVYQAHLHDGVFIGYADFLFRQPGKSKLGDHHYTPLDTKLAHSAKPYFILQLCAYADMLERMQGVRPLTFEFVLGTGIREEFKTDSFFHYYRRFRKAFLDFQQKFDADQMPDPGLERNFGRWTTEAQKILEASDHLSRVARITHHQIKRMREAGVTTMSALAKLKRDAIPGIGSDTVASLKAQARLQIVSRGLDKPKYEIIRPEDADPRRGLALLPPRAELDVFFDMEGFPLVEGGLEYLFGAVVSEKGHIDFRDWWAHDPIQEKAAFEGFVDWAYARWKRDPAMHIYHYAAYEPASMRRLMGKYATREGEVDDLLRNQVFVDLYTIVRQGLVVGTPSYSLKDIEHLYMPPRAGEVTSAGGSVVAYHKWLTSGEGQTWQASEILAEIRDYNRVDCESTLGLRNWLLDLQKKSDIAYLAESKPKSLTENETEEVPTLPAKLLADQLLADIAAGKVDDPERSRVQELLAWLLEFHWREAKPVFWRMFDRHEMTEQELVDDLDCLGAMERTKLAPRPEKRSTVYQYRFDPDQDTKLHEESKCFFAHDLAGKTTIVSFNAETGTVEIKLGPQASTPPQQLSLIPDEYVRADVIANAVYRYVQAWSQGKVISKPVDSLLHRQPPQITGYKNGPLLSEGTELVPQVVDLACRLNGSTLCIQGPPGTGKTYTAAAIIVALLRKKLRIGVTANSHKAILNLMHAIHDAMTKEKVAGRLIKVGKDAEDLLVEQGVISLVESASVIDELANKAVVVGGTAWAFSREELQQQFDYLFVDEAGQFSLANLVATGLSARNLILVGDQMQLSQPIQGSHPGQSGQSGLDYLLNGHATIPTDFGIFLNVTRRMHPDVCGFISQAVYEGRLQSHPDTANQKIVIPKSAGRIDRESGILFVPVEHEGNSQCSVEEVDAIAEIVNSLLGRTVVASDGNKRKLELTDILVVAPYNMQVRRLQHRLGASARIGSVDKFQGLEAPVVIVSMCASGIDEIPRGVEFLLNRNRINVAVSRAQSLAIVVGCPKLMSARCNSIAQMKLVNLICWLADYAEEFP